MSPSGYCRLRQSSLMRDKRSSLQSPWSDPAHCLLPWYRRYSTARTSRAGNDFAISSKLTSGKSKNCRTLNPEQNASFSIRLQNVLLSVAAFLPLLFQPQKNLIIEALCWIDGTRPRIIRNLLKVRNIDASQNFCLTPMRTVLRNSTWLDDHVKRVHQRTIRVLFGDGMVN